MTYMGNSGAQLHVTKIGAGVGKQAMHCKTLGRTISPDVWDIQSDRYSMELLEPININANVLSVVKTMLAEYVWSRSAPTPKWAWNMALRRWAAEFPWIYEKLDIFFGPEHGWCMIHGDPTLANVMRRPRGGLVICDPLAPEVGGKIPFMMEVDLGKLLQSAIGWEEELGADTALDRNEAIEIVLDGLDDCARDRTWLWAAIHCARIIPYASMNNAHLVKWAIAASKTAAAEVGR